MRVPVPFFAYLYFAYLYLWGHQPQERQGDMGFFRDACHRPPYWSHP